MALGASAGRDQKTYSAYTNLRIKAFFHIGVSGLVQELSYCIQALKFHSVVSRMRINLAKISQLTLSSRLFQFSPRQSVLFPFCAVMNFRRGCGRREMGSEGRGAEGSIQVAKKDSYVCILGGRGNIVDRDVGARLLIEAISAKAARPQGHVVDREKYPEKVRCFV